MIAISELRSLPLPERLRLVEDLWNSIVNDQNSLPDGSLVTAEVLARKARFKANPNSGNSWEATKAGIRSTRA